MSRSNILGFAQVENVRLRHDDCGDEMLLGRRGHVFEYGSGRMGLYLTFNTKRQWSAAKRKLLAAGFVITQEGDTEGVATFDASNAGQVLVALKLAGIHRRRKPSAAMLAALATARDAALKSRTRCSGGGFRGKERCRLQAAATLQSGSNVSMP
jgi:hypothetical protein